MAASSEVWTQVNSVRQLLIRQISQVYWGRASPLLQRLFNKGLPVALRVRLCPAFTLRIDLEKLSSLSRVLLCIMVKFLQQMVEHIGGEALVALFGTVVPSTLRPLALDMGVGGRASIAVRGRGNRGTLETTLAFLAGSASSFEVRTSTRIWL